MTRRWVMFWFPIVNTSCCVGARVCCRVTNTRHRNSHHHRHFIDVGNCSYDCYKSFMINVRWQTSCWVRWSGCCLALLIRRRCSLLCMSRRSNTCCRAVLPHNCLSSVCVVRSRVLWKRVATYPTSIGNRKRSIIAMSINVPAAHQAKPLCNVHRNSAFYSPNFWVCAHRPYVIAPTTIANAFNWFRRWFCQLSINKSTLCVNRSSPLFNVPLPISFMTQDCW